MAETYIGKNGTLRLYEGTAPTPFFLEFVYEAMDFTGAFAPARPDEIAVLDRGNHNVNGHYVQGLDDPVVEPIEVSFSCRLDDTQLLTRLEEALNVYGAASWVVDGDTWVTTKATTTRDAGDGSAVTTYAFADDWPKRTNDLVLLWTAAASDKGFRWNEILWPPEQQEIGEAEDAINVSLTGQCYGSTASLTALPDGTAS